MAEHEVVLLLGGDLGDQVRQLQQAEEAIGARIGQVRSRSRDHWTAPWGFSAPTVFLNRALLVTTALESGAVLDQCLAIEGAMGRIRSSDGAVGSRLIDIDILVVGQRILHTPQLVVPHPRLHQRRFALAPLCDLLPGWVHPQQGRTALDLLNALGVA